MADMETNQSPLSPDDNLTNATQTNDYQIIRNSQPQTFIEQIQRAINSLSTERATLAAHIARINSDLTPTRFRNPLTQYASKTKLSRQAFKTTLFRKIFNTAAKSVLLTR